MSLSFSEQQNALFKLFFKWHSSADRDHESERLGVIDIDDIKSYGSLVRKDLLDNLSPLDADLVRSMLKLIIAGDNKYTIKEHFEGMLVAVGRPLDEKCFAREILKALGER